VSSTHANPLAVKTDAPPNVIWDVMRAWVKKQGKEKQYSPGEPQLLSRIGAMVMVMRQDWCCPRREWPCAEGSGLGCVSRRWLKGRGRCRGLCVVGGSGRRVYGKCFGPEVDAVVSFCAALSGSESGFH